MCFIVGVYNGFKNYQQLWAFGCVFSDGMSPVMAIKQYQKWISKPWEFSGFSHVQSKSKMGIEENKDSISIQSHFEKPGTLWLFNILSMFNEFNRYPLVN